MLIVHNQLSAEHLVPQGHPERPARIEAVLSAVRTVNATHVEAPLATRDDLALGHSAAYIDAIEAAQPKEGMTQIDGDTFASPHSWEAAMRGVGGCLFAVDQVLAGKASRAFVATRPPGHHAEKDRAMGFCLFGSVAIAAKHCIERHGLQRVAVVDFDVHHGNGTQDILWDEPRSLFISSHQMPLFPGSGAASERGSANNVLNVALPPGSHGDDMRSRYEQVILPRLDAFEPELILVSAGFDAHERDPLANLQWDGDDFAWITREIVQIAEAHCAGRVVSSLEGGYDLEGLFEGVSAHVNQMVG